MSFFTLPDLLFYFQVSVIVTEHSEIYIQNKKLAKTFKIFTSLYYSPFSLFCTGDLILTRG